MKSALLPRGPKDPKKGQDKDPNGKGANPLAEELRRRLERQVREAGAAGAAGLPLFLHPAVPKEEATPEAEPAPEVGPAPEEVSGPEAAPPESQAAAPDAGIPQAEEAATPEAPEPAATADVLVFEPLKITAEKAPEPEAEPQEDAVPPEETPSEEGAAEPAATHLAPPEEGAAEPAATHPAPPEEDAAEPAATHLAPPEEDAAEPPESHLAPSEEVAAAGSATHLAPAEPPPLEPATEPAPAPEAAEEPAEVVFAPDVIYGRAPEEAAPDVVEPAPLDRKALATSATRGPGMTGGMSGDMAGFRSMGQELKGFQDDVLASARDLASPPLLRAQQAPLEVAGERLRAETAKTLETAEQLTATAGTADLETLEDAAGVPDAGQRASEEQAAAALEEPKTATTEEELHAAAEAPPVSRGGGGGGGGGAGKEAAAWSASVAASTAAIPDPDFSAVVDAPQKVEKAGKEKAAKQREGVDKLKDEAKATLEDPPQIEQLPPQPEDEDPVPGVSQAITAASDKRLPSQSLPTVEKSPGGHQATLQRAPKAMQGSGSTFVVNVTGPPPPPGPVSAERTDTAPPATDVSKAGEKAQKAVAQKPAGEPEPAPAPAGPIELVDEGPPPAPEFSGAEQADIAKVVARLFDDTEGDVTEMLSAARKAAYPQGALEQRDKEFGNDLKPDLRRALEQELRGIATAAGIADTQLDQAIAERKAQVESEKLQASVAVDVAAVTAEREAAQAAEEKAGSIDSALEWLHGALDEQANSALDQEQTTQVRSRRDRWIRKTQKRVSEQLANYRLAREERLGDLDGARKALQAAYRQVAERDRDLFLQQAEQETGDDKAKAKARSAAITRGQESRAWAETKSGEVGLAIRTLEGTVKKTSEGYDKAIKDAGSETTEALRAWADQQLGVERSWLVKLIQQVLDSIQQSRTNADAWGQRRQQEGAKQIAGDLALLQGLRTSEQARIDFQKKAQAGQLSQEEMLVVQTYFADPPGGGNAIAAVAAGMKARIRGQRVPMMTEQLQEKVRSLPLSEWEFLDSIGAAQRPGFAAQKLSGDLYEAMKGGLTGAGTDEDAIFSALASLTPEQARAVRGAYNFDWGRDLDYDLADELSGAEQKRAEALISGDQAMADAAALYEAMKGGITGWGTDEAAIMATLRNKSPEERQAIIEAYREVSGGADLSKHLEDEMEDNDLRQAEAHMAGNTALADAIEIESAMSGGWFFGAGTDEKAIEGVYERTRSEVAEQARREGWTAEEMEAEVARRNGAIDKEFGNEFAGKYETEEGQSALRGAFHSELSDADLKLMNALADNNQAAADSARLRGEFRSFVTDDDAVNAGLERASQRARLHVELDVDADRRALQRRVDAGEKLTPEEEKRLKTPRDQLIAEKLPAVEKKYFGEVQKDFDRTEGFDGALRLRIAFTTTGADKRAAFARLDHAGTLPGEMKVQYALEDGDEDGALKVIKDATPEQVEAMRKRHDAKHGQGAFDKLIEDNMEGRQLQDAKYHMLPPTKDPTELIRRERERIQWELANANAPWAAAEKRMLQRRLERLEQAQKDLENAPADDPRRFFLEERIQRRVEGVESGVETLRQGVDKGLDTILTGISIYYGVLALAAAVVLTIVTGGAAAPLIAGIVIGLMGTLTTVAVKQSVLGDAYRGEDLATDLTIGAVDALVSAATAGLGDKLLKAGRLAALAGRGVWSKIIAHGIAESIESVAGSAPSALTGMLMDDAVMQAHDTFDLVLEGTATEVGMSLLMDHGMSGAMSLGGKVMSGFRAKKAGLDAPHVEGPKSHAKAQGDPAASELGVSAAEAPQADVDLGGDLGGAPAQRAAAPDAVAAETQSLAPDGGAPAADSPELRQLGDAVEAERGPVRPEGEAAAGDEALPGNAEQRAALWNQFQKDNPGASHQDFLDALGTGAISLKDADAAVAGMHKEMRGELLGSLSPEDAAHFRDVEIEVLSDADFDLRTRSHAGEAVVVIEGGEAKVLVRESASPKVLREEAPHLQQLLDPTTRHKVLALDEANLARWDDMDLDEQLALYQNKVELEIDAYERLQRQLRSALDDSLDAPDGPERRALLDQLAAAEATLGNLKKRLDEVTALTPTQRVDIATGRQNRPQYLDQPARLFAKKPKAQPLKPELKAALDKVPGPQRGEARSAVQRLRSADPQAYAMLTQSARQIRDPAKVQELLDNLVHLSKKFPDAAEFQKVTQGLGMLQPRSFASFLHAGRRLDADSLAAVSGALGRLGHQPGNRTAIAESIERLGRQISDPVAFNQAAKTLGELGQRLDPHHLHSLLRTSQRLNDEPLAAFIGALDRFAKQVPDPAQLKQLIKKLDQASQGLSLDQSNAFFAAVERLDPHVLGQVVDTLGQLPESARHQMVETLGKLSAQVTDPGEFTHLAKSLGELGQSLPPDRFGNLLSVGDRLEPAAFRSVVDAVSQLPPAQRLAVLDSLDRLSTKIADPVVFRDLGTAISKLSVNADPGQLASVLHLASHLELSGAGRQSVDFVSGVADRAGKLNKANAKEFFQDLDAVAQLPPDRIAALTPLLGYVTERGDPSAILKGVHAIAAGANPLGTPELRLVVERIAGGKPQMSASTAQDYLDSLGNLLKAHPDAPQRLQGLIAAAATADQAAEATRLVHQLADAGLSPKALEHLGKAAQKRGKTGGMVDFLEVAVVVTEQIPDPATRNLIFAASSHADNGIAFLSAAYELHQRPGTFDDPGSGYHGAALSKRQPGLEPAAYHQLLQKAASDPDWADAIPALAKQLADPNLSGEARWLLFLDYNTKIKKGEIPIQQKMTLKERLEALVKSWTTAQQAKYAQLEVDAKAKHGSDFYAVVPLEGVEFTGDKLGNVIDPQDLQDLTDLVTDMLKTKGMPHTPADVQAYLQRILNHDIVIVRGTTPLRKPDAPAILKKATGAAATGEVHHFIPLYLGGTSEAINLLDLDEVLHRRFHELFERMKYRGATFAPWDAHSGATLQPGAAVVLKDGTIIIHNL